MYMYMCLSFLSQFIHSFTFAIKFCYDIFHIKITSHKLVICLCAIFLIEFIYYTCGANKI